MEGRMPDLVFEAAIMSVYDRTSETGGVGSLRRRVSVGGHIAALLQVTRFESDGSRLVRAVSDRRDDGLQNKRDPVAFQAPP